MAGTFSKSNRIELQADGRNEDTWGDITSRNFEFLEDANEKRRTVDLDGLSGDVHLTLSNTSSDEARMRFIRLTGEPAGAVTIVVPNVPKTRGFFLETGNSETVEVRISDQSSSQELFAGFNPLQFNVGEIRRTGAAVSSSLVTFPGSLEVGRDSTISGQGSIPEGAIVKWNGVPSNVPTGWALCDGANGTPDLRDLFIVGAGGVYDPDDTGGNETETTSSDGSHNHSMQSNGSHDHGGTNNHTLNISRMPSHTHPPPASVQDESVGYSKVSTSDGDFTNGRINEVTNTRGGSGSHSHGISNAGSHTHSVNSNGDHTHEYSTMSPYYALAFIKKV
jgi:hypothetical protein